MTRRDSAQRGWRYAKASLALLLTYIAVSAAATFTLNRCCISAGPFIEDRHALWGLRPNFRGIPRSYGNARIKPVHIDERGFRVPETTAQQRDRQRATILAVGDSFTFGWDVADDETYPAQLQSVLDRERPGTFEVINVGVPGYTSFQARQRLPRWMAALGARIVIVWLGRNEGRRAFISDARAQRLLRWKPAASNYVFPFMLVHFRKLQRWAERLGAKPGRRVSLAEFHTNMEEIIRVAQANRAGVILMEHWARRGTSFRVEPLAAVHGLRYIATPELLAREARGAQRPLMLPHFHPSKDGYAVIARAVANVILSDATHAAVDDAAGWQLRWARSN